MNVPAGRFAVLRRMYTHGDWISVMYRTRNSSVGIATRYGLDGPGIESQWGGPVQTGSEAHTHPASYIMRTGSFPGVKQSRRGVDHPPPSSAEVKERIELYLFPSLGLMNVLG